MKKPRKVDLFCVQPKVALRHYLSFESFFRKTRSLLEMIARARRSEHALVLFPEYYCGFLSAVGAGARAQGAKTLSQALTWAALLNWKALLKRAWQERRKDLSTLFLLERGESAKKELIPFFSHQAKMLRAYLGLGTGLFPGGDDRRVHNTALLFSPRGELVLEAAKVNLVPGVEDVLLDSSRAKPVPVCETPFGKVGFAICYDGFAEPHTRYEVFDDVVGELDRQGVEILLHPSANPWPWGETWAYGSFQEGMTREEQWAKEGLQGQLSRLHSAKVLLNPMLHGDLFDLKFDGLSTIWVRNGEWTCAVGARRRERSEEILLYRWKV